MQQLFVKRSRIAAPAQRVFDWHREPDAFVRLTPPWEKAELVERTGGIDRGLGWDIDSPFAYQRGENFPVGGFGTLPLWISLK